VVREVNIDSGEATKQDVVLVPLSRQRVRFLDPNAQPLSGVRVGGRRPKSALNETDVFHRAQPVEESSVNVLGLESDGKRLLLFSQDDRKSSLRTRQLSR